MVHPPERVPWSLNLEENINVFLRLLIPERRVGLDTSGRTRRPARSIRTVHSCGNGGRRAPENGDMRITSLNYFSHLVEEVAESSVSEIGRASCRERV